MKSFAKRRRIINALQTFRPGMEDQEEEITAEVMILVFLAFVGFCHLVVYFGMWVIWMTAV